MLNVFLAVNSLVRNNPFDIRAMALVCIIVLTVPYHFPHFVTLFKETLLLHQNVIWAASDGKNCLDFTTPLYKLFNNYTVGSETTNSNYISSVTPLVWVLVKVSENNSQANPCLVSVPLFAYLGFVFSDVQPCLLT